MRRVRPSATVTKRKKKSDGSGNLPASSPPESSGATQLRDAHGKFLPGRSGNPKGKPKGTRNYIKQQQLALEGAIRKYLANDDNLGKVQQVLDRIFEIALNGEDKHAVAMIKKLMDMTVANPKDGEEAAGGGPKELRIVIENNTEMDASKSGRPVEVVVDGEFEDIS